MKKPEIWKPIEELDGAYEISNYGRVKSFAQNKKEGKILAYKIGKSGYPQYCIQYKGIYISFYAHRKVAQMFVPNPYNLPFVDHIDNIKDNLYYENFQWIEHLDNCRKDQADPIICEHLDGRSIIGLGLRHCGQLTGCNMKTVIRSLKNGKRSKSGWLYKYKK